MYAKQPTAYLHIVPAILSVVLVAAIVDIDSVVADATDVSSVDYIASMIPIIAVGALVFFGLTYVNVINLRRLYRANWIYDGLNKLRGPLAYFIFLMRTWILSGITAVNCVLFSAYLFRVKLTSTEITPWCITTMIVIAAAHLVAERRHLGKSAWEDNYLQ
jgi:hypothetical protein